jgi:hypothetical protein
VADPSVPEITVRVAKRSDAARLTAIRSAINAGGPDDPLHHLGIPAGDDYFCLVAEIDGEVVGYLSTGGSRDEDRKSYGEFYEIAVALAVDGSPVLAHLTDVGWERFVVARFGGVITWVHEFDDDLRRTLSATEFTVDVSPRDNREGLSRFGRAVRPAAPGDSLRDASRPGGTLPVDRGRS